MTITTSSTDRWVRDLEDKEAKLDELIADIEDQLSMLYPQRETAHNLTSSYARGPAPRLLRQLKAIDRKIELLEPKLEKARADIRATRTQMQGI